MILRSWFLDYSLGVWHPKLHLMIQISVFHLEVLNPRFYLQRSRSRGITFLVYLFLSFLSKTLRRITDTLASEDIKKSYKLELKKAYLNLTIYSIVSKNTRDKKNVMRCAIQYNLYNFKNVKNSYVEVLLLVPVTLLKITLLRECFSRFLNFANGTKSRKAHKIFRIFMGSFVNPIFSTFRFFINISLYIPDFIVKNLPVSLNCHRVWVGASF